MEDDRPPRAPNASGPNASGLPGGPWGNHLAGQNAEGEVDAELFRALYPGLRRFAAAVGSVDVDPDDLVQDALVRVLRHGSLSRLDDPLAYLRRTIVNLAADRRRGFGRMRRAFERIGTANAAPAEYPSDLDDLLALPPEVRAVLWLADVEGRSFDEIAQVLGCSVTAARTRASRGRRDVRIALAAEVALADREERS